MRAGAYARYSTYRQTENSIEAQLNGITEYCEKNGIDISRTFIDQAKSGTNTNRSGFQKLLQAAESGAIDAVVIYDVTRGSRDVADWFYFRKEMLRLHIKVISATERLGDITDPNDFMVELITVGMGQHQVLQTRQKSREGIEVLARKGKFCGGFPPLGYDVADGDYVINAHEAAAVKTIFSMYAAGKSYSEIVDWLFENGIMSKRGKRIGNNALYAILRNERYIGRYSWNKRQVKLLGKWAGGKENPRAIFIDDVIPKIIDEETWKKVHKRMDENKHDIVNKSRVNRVYLLSGLIRCKKCGGAFGGVTTTNKKGYEYSFYTCLNKKRLRSCDAKNIAVNEIEPLVVLTIKDKILNGDLIEQTADAILAACADDGADDLALMKKSISEIDAKVDNLMHALETGLDSDSVRSRITELESHKKILEERMKSIVPMDRLTKEELVEKLSEDKERLISDPSCLAEIVKKYIVNILIDDDTIEINAVSDYLLYRNPRRLYVCRDSDLNTAGG